MNTETIKSWMKKHPDFKLWLLNRIVNPVKTRPRLWLRFFQFLYLKKGKKSFIYRSVRKDVVPFNKIKIGNHSLIEKNSTINNMVGDIIIGDRCLIGLSNTIIGPVKFGNDVTTAQQITISGLNHNFEDISTPINRQGVNTKQVTLEDDIWIGANCVILQGVTIGKHSIVGAGSIVTHSIPAYSVAVGNPAKIVKTYDLKNEKWIKA